MFRSIFTTIFRGLMSSAHEPPEDDRKYGPKHVGAIFKNVFKCFKY